jgi:DNA repair protein RecO (recombination protein O)
LIGINNHHRKTDEAFLMSRTAVYSALILRSRPSKFASAGNESNSEIFLLTAEEGIIRVTVFGGPKSKLRAYAAPYNSGQVWIYRDPAKDYGKLSDFDVHSWRTGLRELYERTMAAAGVAETILSTHGGGSDWSEALKLAMATLDALEDADEESCSRLLVHFLWRWARILGLQPDIENCASCSKTPDTGALLWFDPREGTVLCASCAKETDSAPNGLLQLNPGCRRWLAAVEELEPSNLYRYSMDNKSFSEAKVLTTAILAATLGKRLKSWDW